MVKVVRLESATPLEMFVSIPELFHADPLHPTFGLLKEMGANVSPIPIIGLKPGSTLLLPPPDQQEFPQLKRLVQIVTRLLGPGGCPWDREQTHETLKKYLIEEAYEVIDAIDSGNQADLIEELGDLLLQPIMHAQMEALENSFDIEAVAQGISDKLTRRHPHVFGDTEVSGADNVLKNWDKIKQAEGKKKEETSLLGEVPRHMPALSYALQISVRAARSGFEWESMQGVRDKVAEELAELDEALEGADKERIASELGDLLFTIVNIARWQKIDPEDALRQMVNRFSSRFKTMEKLANHADLSKLSPAEWDALWNQAKQAEYAN